jgi:hypothetical protein
LASSRARRGAHAFGLCVARAAVYVSGTVRGGGRCGGNEAFVGEGQTPQQRCSFLLARSVLEVVWLFPHILALTGPAALPQGQSTAARASLTSLHMGKNIFQKKEIIKNVR